MNQILKIRTASVKSYELEYESIKGIGKRTFVIWV